MGSVLCAKEIRERRDEIFVGGTFAERCLRAAAYDLRIRADGDVEKTTGRLNGGTLHLQKGQRAVLETFEVIAMPWDLTGNLGVKARLALLGLFFTQGLFVDPGFGWAVMDSGECGPKGARLRFMITNMGNDPISIRLGEQGDRVVGMQLFTVTSPAKRELIEDIPVDPQGLSVFEDMRQLEAGFVDVQTRVSRTESATDRIVVFGVFLVAATLFGALIAFLLTLIASGNAATRLVNILNRLNASHPWTAVLLVGITVIAIMCIALLAMQVCRMYRVLSGSPQRSTETD